jgi:hypothetical protein
MSVLVCFQYIVCFFSLLCIERYLFSCGHKVAEHHLYTKIIHLCGVLLLSGMVVRVPCFRTCFATTFTHVGTAMAVAVA